MAERLRAELPGARVVEIPDAYHHIVLDGPDAFVRALREFLDALDAEAAGIARPAGAIVEPRP